MLGDARFPTNSCGDSIVIATTTTTTTTTTTITASTITTTKTTSRRMSPIGKFYLTLALLAILGHRFVDVDGAPFGDLTVRLCSKGLSDALYLVCKDHGGYNEPLSYSGEDYSRQPSGPSLVEECCYHSCTYQQLEQYCKHASDEKGNGSQDGIEESLRIVYLPDPSAREFVDKSRTAVAAIERNDRGNKNST